MSVSLPTALGAIVAAAVAGATAGASINESPTPACTAVPLAVVVDLRDDHEQIIAHARDAVSQGQPRILHVDRAGAEARRRLSLRAIPIAPGFDRDEYPPAISTEGGPGAHIRYIESSENRSAGSVMGRQLRPFCDGQPFIVEP